MTLENCKRLLKHYNDLIDGTIKAPKGHKNWTDVIHNAKIRAAEMEARVKKKTERYIREGRIEEPKKEVKKNVKK